MEHVIPVPPSVAFEQEIATRLRRDFPSSWIVHDCYVGEEQIDVLAVLPQGIFAIGRSCGTDEEKTTISTCGDRFLCAADVSHWHSP
jgi:hypothetical protein